MIIFAVNKFIYENINAIFAHGYAFNYKRKGYLRFA